MHNQSSVSLIAEPGGSSGSVGSVKGRSASSKAESVDFQDLNNLQAVSPFCGETFLLNRDTFGPTERTSREISLLVDY